ncbi:MAG: DUF4012 domain-containing protein [bacterium]
MSHRFRHSWHSLTIVRIMRLILSGLIAIGAWEEKLFCNLTGYQPTRRQRLMRSTRRISWRWLHVFLINLGYVTSQVISWPFKQLWQLVKLLAKVLFYLPKLLWLIIFWPIKQLFTGFKQVGRTGQRALQTISHLPKQAKRWQINPSWSLLKPALAFAVITAVLILPLKLYGNYQLLNVLKDKVINVSQAAIGDLFSAQSALEDQDFVGASQDFGQASANFLQAQNQLEAINDNLFVLAKLIPNQTVQLAGDSKHIVRSGQLAAEVGSYISSAIDSLLVNTKGKKFIQVLSEFSSYGHQALVKADELNEEINKINVEALPVDYQDEFLILADQAVFLQSSLRELLDIADSLQIFLGASYDKRYLLVFQNNTEMRASGGFMGSFATVDFSQGEIKNLTTPGGGTYDTEGGMRVLVQAPEPLRLVNPLWHLWDCNWWPDWPKSANKIMWFYEKSDGSTVDGVISLTPTVIERLLSVIGPVDMTKDYGVVIDENNFLMTVQELAEAKTDDNQPKKIIGDLLEAIMQQLSSRLDKAKLIKLIEVIDSSLAEKHILLYFTDQTLQDKVKELGWSAAIEPTGFDYLQVVNTNIAGGKSDRDMKQKIYLASTIRPDGSIVNELTIERQHLSIRGEKFSGVRNVNWLRVYVPLGSQLISASGWRAPDSQFFEAPDSSWQVDPDIAEELATTKVDTATNTKIYEDSSRTVFANWSMLDPGETAIIKITYKLPFNLAKQAPPARFWEKLRYLVDPNETYAYSLLVQKQPGSQKTEMYYTLDIQNGLQTIWNYPEVADTKLTADKYWSYLLAGPDF